MEQDHEERTFNIGLAAVVCIGMAVVIAVFTSLIH
jgi:hypothetical protein